MHKISVNSLVFYLKKAEYDKIKNESQGTEARIQYLTEHCEVCIDTFNNQILKCRGSISIQSIFDNAFGLY